MRALSGCHEARATPVGRGGPQGGSNRSDSGFYLEPLTELNRRPPPYHREAGRSLKVVDADQWASVGRIWSASVVAVAALCCCTDTSLAA